MIIVDMQKLFFSIVVTDIAHSHGIIESYFQKADC